ncbi:DUF3429 domain-containing protein [Maritimibacter sp. UBA3975]|uniref:DUF3429 domain-containing protein n=1 Tax=Maritimibacter sp. UBA3975 TaxID=1946833 RepID=UPI000C0A1D4A|nr:DUF3429 domain-containing protein [Maritimibacter sp. UBA3975]MAM61902.1 DUF3429 domain-containing protein [Maritimibacter sp.]|tara:strand:- start:4687 stop:5115 length:429 start_codon:yes stop_codon:yes gene_type:complete
MSLIPRVPLLLGLAGLIPFVWGLVTSFVAVPALSDYFVGFGVLADYGMIILAFMSGVIWGFATRATGRQATTFYVISVIPALWAFFFAFGENTLLTLAAGFLFILPVDIAAARARLAPDWWPRLRLLLTAVVVPCLVIGHFA